MSSPHAQPKPITISARQPTSFNEEQRELMQRRCRLAYALGFTIAVSVHLFYIEGVGLDPELSTAFARWINRIYDLYAVSVGLAAALVFLKTWSLRALLVIDFVLLSFNILLSHFIAVVFDLNAIPMFAISILLFLHAAVIPVTVASQAGLAVIGALGFATTAALGYVLVPEIQYHWRVVAGIDSYRAIVIEGTFQLSIVAITSVAITKALYHMRLSLHKVRRLGAYLVEKEIGRGGMGQVFVAQHALMCRPSAVKVMHATSAEGEAALLRFEREVRLSATLTHPNTITVYDFGRTEDDTFYYAMEYLEGLNLEDLVLRFGPMRPERTTFILAQVCGSLAEAHANNVVHRDIKPSNVFVTRRGGIYDFAKVVDFGLAKQIIPDSDRKVTATGMILGTPHFIAPESVSGAGGIDGRADLYGLGGVAYWLLAGRPPFEGESSMELLVQHVRARPKLVSEASEYCIPKELEALVMKCLEKEPQSRYQSATEMGEALRAISFEDPWTTERARDWWRLHLPELGESPTPPDTTNPLTT